MDNAFAMTGLHAHIGTAEVGGVWTYAELAKGLENIAEALNEVVQQFQFLSGRGFAQNQVTGMAPAVTISGRRVMGDAAQDYIFSKKYKLGADRQTSFRLTWNDASGARSLVVPATLCNVQEFSGATTDASAISFELRFDAEPAVDAALAPLSVVSVAGGASGKTKIYVNPILSAGNSYVYKTAAVVALPVLGTALSAGWTALTIGADITAVTGQQIAVVEIGADTKAIKGGLAIVTSL